MRKASLIAAAAVALLLTASLPRSRPGSTPALPGEEDAVRHADALLRAARVRSDAALAVEAERVLATALQRNPADYGLRRMVGIVLLSQHRFADALVAAREARALRPADAWNYAVEGDALLELGRYGDAFDAFDAAMSRRPDAATYARVAYARELQGDLDGAVRLMRMAAESTAPQDVEAGAWTSVQLGSLLLLQGRMADAERELRRAEFLFPGHPYAAALRVRLHVARGELRPALEVATRAADTPELLAVRGDLLARLGESAAADACYRRAEQLERDGWKHEQPQRAALARFLAERRRDVPAAVSLAEEAVRERKDIHTLDALAWSYFRAGRLDEAAAAIRPATGIGTRDPRILCHASAIRTARQGRLRPDANVCDPLELMAAPHEPIQHAARPVGISERQ